MRARTFVICLGTLVFASEARADSASPLPPTTAAASPQSTTPFVSWFLTPGVRVQYTLQTANIAFAGEFGARVGFLQFGLAFLYRPAVWGGDRVTYPLPENVTYKGQNRLELGQQHLWIGPMVAPRFMLDRQERWSLEVPLSGGAAILGTPLLGNDRKVPDGRRVSDWEDELLAGQDRNLGAYVDVGVRVRYAPTELPWMRAGIGVHYTAFVGFNSPILGNQTSSGPSLSFSVALGP
jgi:hypothetical protein